MSERRPNPPPPKVQDDGEESNTPAGQPPRFAGRRPTGGQPSQSSQTPGSRFNSRPSSSRATRPPGQQRQGVPPRLSTVPRRPPTTGLAPDPEGGVAALALSVANARPLTPPDRTWPSQPTAPHSDLANPAGIRRPGAPEVENVTGLAPFHPHTNNPDATFSAMDLTQHTPQPQPTPSPAIPFLTDPVTGEEIPMPHVLKSPTQSEVRHAVGGGSLESRAPTASPAPSRYVEIPVREGGTRPGATFEGMGVGAPAPAPSAAPQNPPRRRDSLKNAFNAMRGKFGSGSKGPPDGPLEGEGAPPEQR